MSGGLEWKGDLIVAKVERAAVSAVGETVDAAVELAAGRTPVLTGEARDSLRKEGSGLSVTWGYHVLDEQGHDRGIWIEIGARGKSGAHALRRSADDTYPTLATRIARRVG